MSKFIYKGTLNEKYISGTILSDNVEANKVSVNTIDSTREDINILKNVSIDGDLDVSGSINADFDLSTIKTNTITSDNNSIDINKQINTNGINNTGIITSTNDISTTNIKLDNTNKKVKVINNNNVWDNYICDGQGTLIGKNGTGTNGEIFNDYINNTASGDYSHAEGSGTEASGSKAHAEGNSTHAKGMNSHTEGSLTYATNSNSHAEGTATRASGISSHSSGSYTISSQENEFVIGTYNIDETGQTTNKLFVIGNGTDTNNRNDLFFVKSTGEIEGNGTITAKNGNNKIKLDPSTNKIKISSDNGTNWIDYNTGSNIGQNGTGTNAEIFNDYSNNTASGQYSHAEGQNNTSSGRYSHSEGQNNTASGWWSHAEGYNTQALSDFSNSSGRGTISNTQGGMAIGNYNISSNDKLFVVGNGADNNNRNDAFYVKTNGESFIDGQLFIKNEYGSDNTKSLLKIYNHVEQMGQEFDDIILNVKQGKIIDVNGCELYGLSYLNINNEISAQNVMASNDIFSNNFYLSGSSSSDAKVQLTGSSETLDIKTSTGGSSFDYNGKITGPSFESNGTITAINGNNRLKLDPSTNKIKVSTNGGTNWSDYNIYQYQEIEGKFMSYFNEGMNSNNQVTNSDASRTITCKCYIFDNSIKCVVPVPSNLECVFLKRCNPQMTHFIDNSILLNLNIKPLLNSLSISLPSCITGESSLKLTGFDRIVSSGQTTYNVRAFYKCNIVDNYNYENTYNDNDILIQFLGTHSIDLSYIRKTDYDNNYSPSDTQDLGTSNHLFINQDEVLTEGSSPFTRCTNHIPHFFKQKVCSNQYLIFTLYF